MPSGGLFKRSVFPSQQTFGTYDLRTTAGDFHVLSGIIKIIKIGSLTLKFKFFLFVMRRAWTLSFLRPCDAVCLCLCRVYANK